MENILVVCPCPRAYPELLRYNDIYNLIMYDYTEKELCGFVKSDTDVNAFLRQISKSYEKYDLAGVAFTNDLGSVLGSVIAQNLSLNGPQPADVLKCQHKFHARQAQQKYAPEMIPKFSLLDHQGLQSLTQNDFPLFIKPVKAVFSIGAAEVQSMEQLKAYLQPNTMIPPEFLHAFDQIVSLYLPNSTTVGQLIAESVLEGVQCTVEGFVHNGKVNLIGIVDSIMFENKISFKRFEYPSRLPLSVQDRMQEASCKVIAGTGLDSTFFNIEFMYNPKQDSLFIIEINPRMSSQFADLFEKVDGTNTYGSILELAIGRNPEIKKRKGNYQVSGSFVLRVFEDKFVKKVPMKFELAQFYDTFPDGRFELCCVEDKKLSELKQDGHSYRYGLIHLGAQSWAELYQAFQEAKKILNFQLEPV